LPESRHWLALRECLLCANSGHCTQSQAAKYDPLYPGSLRISELNSLT
jgi:hypothetical protein